METVLVKEVPWFDRAAAIPGQLTEREMRTIHKVAESVPKGGVVVETGSLYGRSSFIWAHGVGPDTRVVCIDPWERAQWIIDHVEGPLGAPEFGPEAFRSFTSTCDNIQMLRGYSPECAEDWSDPIDVYFEDSVHEGPIFEANCDFWISHLKPGGIFCGHDFRFDYFDITRRVLATASMWGVELKVVDSFFWLRKPL